jgi:hypothetical protein
VLITSSCSEQAFVEPALPWYFFTFNSLFDETRWQAFKQQIRGKKSLCSKPRALQLTIARDRSFEASVEQKGAIFCLKVMP